MQGNERHRPRLVLRRHQFERLMHARGLTTAAQQAEFLGFVPSTVTRLLAAEVQPSGHFVATACEALGVDITDLFEVVPAPRRDRREVTA